MRERGAKKRERETEIERERDREWVFKTNGKTREQRVITCNVIQIQATPPLPNPSVSLLLYHLRLSLKKSWSSLIHTSLSFLSFPLSSLTLKFSPIFSSLILLFSSSTFNPPLPFIYLYSFGSLLILVLITTNSPYHREAPYQYSKLLVPQLIELHISQQNGNWVVLPTIDFEAPAILGKVVKNSNWYFNKIRFKT